jgi:radical SAM superfamily enzyme YgiQ (UPF0313 family)
MRLLLIQASHLNRDGTVFKSKRLPYPGLALPLIAAMTPSDFDIEIVSDYAEEIDYGVNADLVGITAMTPQAPRAYQIARGFRDQGKKVVIGGFHASLFPEDAIQYCDAVVVGEAEEVWPRVVEDFLAGKMRGIYRAEKHPDLSAVPTPRYDLVKIDGYSLRAHVVQSTRGCPHRCEFCSVHHFFGGTYRHRPVADVVRDIKATGSPYVFFIDDNIAADKKYTMELLAAIKPLGVVWGSQCNLSACEDEEFLKAAHDAGCFALFLGVESVEPASLASAHKGFNKIEKYAEILRKIRDAGISSMVSMMMGMDGDGPQVFDRTFEFLMQNRVAMAYFFIMTPAPCTALFNRLEIEGRLHHKDWSRYGGDECVFAPKGLTPRQLEEGFWDLYKRFYSLPSIFRRVVWPPRWNWRVFLELKFNLLHRKSLRQGIHPLRG